MSAGQSEFTKPNADDVLHTSATFSRNFYAAIAAMKSGDIKAEDYAQVLLDRATRLGSLNAFRVLRPDTV